MTKSLKFLGGLFILAGLVIAGCEKDKDDPAYKFTGTYGYTLTANTFFENEVMTISKISEDKISIMRADSVSRLFSVRDNQVTEDAGQEAKHIPLPGGGWATFTENSSGTINGDKLTINGSWTSPHWETITFKIVATKK